MGVTKKGAGAFAGFLFFLLASTTASATLVNFNGLNDGDNSAAILSYLNSPSQLGAGSVLSVSGAVASQCYNGDGHVIGPNSGNNPCNTTRRSLTLGTTDGYVSGASGLNTSPDTFIMNIGGDGTPTDTSTNDRIKIVFAGGVTSISFDLEIFPDGSCASKTSCGSANPSGSFLPYANWPDFELVVNGTQVNQWKGLDPSAFPYPNSPAMLSETAPQLLTTVTVNFNPSLITTGPTTIEFVDWPERIGIDNLSVVCCKRPPNSNPEPGSLALIGIALAGLAGISRRRRV